MDSDGVFVLNSLSNSCSPDEGEPGHVLVVDDENGPRQALRMLLNQDYKVFLAEDVATAIDLVAQQPAAVIITDLRMPRTSGIELLHWVKQHQPETQVIVLTGFAELATAKKAIEYGALAYIEKPIDNDTILRHVEAGVAKHRHERDRKAFEHAALEANRFETLGRLIAGTIHDLGAPLSVIESLLELLLTKPDRQNITERLNTMQTQVRHCHDLVATAMNFVRHQTFCSVPFILNEAAATCLEVARPLLRNQKVTVKCEFLNDLPKCLGDLVLVRQAILNLIANACHAMDGQDAPQTITLKTWVEQEYVCLSTHDTGPGIAPDDRKHVFDSFFTSRGEQGTGLGLSIVKHVMRQHGGHVVLRESPEGGALFVLKFPLE